MKNILFIVNTEGQLLTASSLVFEKFNKTTGYHPYILQVGKTGTARFQNEVMKALLSDCYFEIDREDKEIKKELKQLLATNFEKVFIFLEQLKLNVYLVNYFKKKGSTICLAPDGNKPYYSVDKAALGSRVKETVKTYLYLFNRKLLYFKPYFLSWNYAKLRPLDEIWVTYPESFFFHNKKKVFDFKVMPNEKVVNEIVNFFNFKVSDTLKYTEDIIFYTNNILYKQEAYDVEIEAIKIIKNNFSDKPFYLKYHPLTPEYQIKKFQELGLICFCNSIPAELYIASLKKSIILGFWSTSLMVENPDCKFYWLHKYLVKKGKMVDYINLANPTKHIIDIDNLDNIIF
jgi:hypothetical protein